MIKTLETGINMAGRRFRSVCMYLTLALAAAIGVGSAQTFSGPAAATAANFPNATAASPYPSSITVAASGTVATVSVVLHNVNSNGNSFSSVAFTGLVLVAPSGKSMEIFGGAGDSTDGGGLSNVTITIKDGNGAVLPPNNVAISPNTGTKNWKPSSFGSGSSPEPHSYLTIGTPQFFATTGGSSTLNSVFVGQTAAGTWKLYLEAFLGDPVSFSSWDLVLTESAAAGTTTSVSSNLNPSFAVSGANSSVTLTATVSSGSSGQPTGTVGFTDNGVSIGCDSVNLAGVGANSSTAACVHTFASEGNRPIIATYTPTGSFAGSTSTTFIQVTRNHSTNPVTNKYCNTGTLVAPGVPNNQFIYPSYLEVPALSNTVANLSVSLNGLQNSQSGIDQGQFLLISPGGNTLDFLSHVGSSGMQPPVNGTIADNNPSAPINGTFPSNFIYEPTDAHNQTDTFGQPPSPNPQVPNSFNQAQPSPGSKTLAQAFNGATGQGNWLLYLYDNGGTQSGVTLASGWCLTFTLNTGNPSTTTIASNNNPARTGVPVTFTATVKDGSMNPITTGTVTFTENGSAPAGTVSGNNVVTVNISGQATFTTSSLTEGDHTILATFTSGSFNSSNQSVIQRVDNNSTITGSSPTLNTLSFCNPGAILIPAGSGGPFDIGQANPNPSNVFVNTCRVYPKPWASRSRITSHRPRNPRSSRLCWLVRERRTRTP